MHLSGDQSIRRSDSRTKILNAAAELLAEGDIHSVTVRAVAGRIGMTDMGVLHYFGSKDELVLSLIDRVGTCLRDELAVLAVDWVRGGARIGSLVEALSDFYASGREGVVIALRQLGWRDNAPAVLEPVVDALQAARTRRLGASIDGHETRLAVSAMHHALALEHRFGFEFRRSAGLMERDAGATAQRRWWVATMAERLGIPP